jgi:hypothetical protein
MSTEKTAPLFAWRMLGCLIGIHGGRHINHWFVHPAKGAPVYYESGPSTFSGTDLNPCAVTCWRCDDCGHEWVRGVSS